ncbi:hypothetical protein CsSME_00001094 [Camellia sinensis var. sinensis]
MFGLTGQPTFIENECMCQCQVPKGWDKLYVSFLSTETGKAVSKSGKASVRNGTCRWTETLSESVWISQDEAPKEFEQYLFKLVVSMLVLTGGSVFHCLCRWQSALI